MEKDLEFESFHFIRRQNADAFQCGLKDGSSGGSKQIARECLARGRSLPAPLPQTFGMPMEFEA